MTRKKSAITTEIQGKWFASRLLKWNRERNNRIMPWKGETNPYRIWLSEIILQQTRVEQGLKYYNNFIDAFPDIRALAAAPDNKVFKLWEGLGYYSRCRNLLATARFIARERKGVFPDTYEEIKALKGIGPYTAAAISSFAFNLPHAVVDGNVFRVLARIYGIDTPIDSTAGKKYFIQLAADLLDKKNPGVYNQAIMDFGAVVCKPVAPLCASCVFNTGCFAFLKNKVNELPVKEKKIRIRKRWFYYLVMQYKEQTAIRQRMTKDIWQQLYEFPLIETGTDEEIKTVLTQAEQAGWLVPGKYEMIAASPVFRQQLSHQLIAGRFLVVKLKTKPAGLKNPITTDPGIIGWQWINKDDLTHYAFPGIINQYLERGKEQSLF